LNILLITENSHPFSGSSAQISALANGLREAGHNATLLYRLDRIDFHFRALKSLDKSERLITAAFHREPRLINEICELRGIDVVHCHMEILPQVVEALRGKKIPIVANYGSSAPLSPRILSSITANSPSAFVSISEGGATLLRSQLSKIQKPRIVVIRQSTDLITSLTEDKRIDAITREEPFILLLATFRTYKGIGHFCRAVETTPRAPRAIVVGRYYPIQIQRLCTELDIIPKRTPDGLRVGRTLFAGPSQFAGSWSLRATVSVSASVEYEGIPGSLREAMLAGAPVVGTDIGYVRELVKPEWNGLLVPAGNARALSQAIIRLTESSTLAARLVPRAKTYVRLFFNNTQRTRRHLELYSELGV